MAAILEPIKAAFDAIMADGLTTETLKALVEAIADVILGVVAKEI